MKRWEKWLLAALIAALLAGSAVHGASAPAQALPAERVYSWWGTVYPNTTTPEMRDGERYILKFRTVELWQQLCERIRSGTT